MTDAGHGPPAMQAAVPPAGPVSAAEAKAFAAEKNTAMVRLAVILFGVTVYWTLWYPRGIPWLAATISVVALLYGIYDAAFQPYRRFPALLTSRWTATTDATLIVLWLHGTGDAASPFYPLWYLSLVAVAFRYDWKATVVAALVYVGAYTGLVAVTGGFPAAATDMVVRCGYLLLLGALGALLARSSATVFEERFRLAQRVHEQEAQAEALRREMEVRRLEEVNRFKTEFINSAAHELNTPLTPLLLQTHRLRTAKTLDAQERERLVGVLDRNLRRLAHLVQDMLDVARLQSGRLRLDSTPFDARRVLAESAESFADASHAKGVRVAVEPGDPLPTLGDARRIGQVVDNLVSNAIKFTPAGGTVTVAGHRGPEGTVLRVSDTGIGLRPDQVASLFQPFARLHADLGVPGTGLGLYICRGIVEGHGGTITCESLGPGQGTTFTVRLPPDAAPPRPEP
jgi:signal transduction histidine kinase